MRFAEVVDSVKSLEEFMKVNKITPNEIIVVWDEEIDGFKKLDYPKPKWWGRSYNKVADKDTNGK